MQDSEPVWSEPVQAGLAAVRQLQQPADRLPAILDTRRFCLTLLIRENPDWSYTRLQEEAESLCRYILLGLQPERDNAMLLALLDPPASR